MKRVMYVLLLFLGMVATVFACVRLCVSDVFWLLKICVVLAGIALSAFLFIMISKINKAYLESIPQNEKEETAEEETNKEEYSTKHVLCPKCHKPFDEIYCFHCGYEVKNKEN